MIVTSIAAVEVGIPIPARTLIDFFFALVFFVLLFFSRHISNLNFRNDTFLNANSYFSFTSLNHYPHSHQNPFILKAVKSSKNTSTMAPEPPLLTAAAATAHHSSAIPLSQYPCKCSRSLIPDASFATAPPAATHKPIPNMLHGSLVRRCVGRV